MEDPLQGFGPGFSKQGQLHLKVMVLVHCTPPDVGEGHCFTEIWTHLKRKILIWDLMHSFVIILNNTVLYTRQLLRK